MRYSVLSLLAAMVFLDVAPTSPSGCRRDDDSNTQQLEAETTAEVKGTDTTQPVQTDVEFEDTESFDYPR